MQKLYLVLVNEVVDVKTVQGVDKDGTRMISIWN